MFTLLQKIESGYCYTVTFKSWAEQSANLGYLVPKCFGKSNRCRLQLQRLGRLFPALRGPLEGLASTDYYRRRGALQLICPIVVFGVLASLAVNLPISLRSPTSASGPPDFISLYNCNEPGYFGGGNWTFLGIDATVGKMSFANAKILDLSWNWLVGRGLQLVLAFLSYKVFTSALMRITEREPVSAGTYMNLAFYATKVDSLLCIFRSLTGEYTLRAKFSLGWMLLSTVYLTFVPSILDIMTGYEASISTTLRLPNQTTIDTTELDSLTDLLTNGQDSLDPYNFNFTGSGTHCDLEGMPHNGSFCKALLQSNYPKFYDSQLNASWVHHMFYGTTFWTEDPKHNDCVAEKNVYRWGFSGEWVFIALIIHTVWTFGMTMLWWDAQFNSQFYQKRRRMGPYRALMDLGPALQKELGPSHGAYSDEELEAELQKRPHLQHHVESKDGESYIKLSPGRSEKFKLHWNKKYG